VREGKVLQWGAIVDELEGAEALIGEPWLVALQVTYNACQREAVPLLDAAAAAKVAVLARRPFAGGALTGTLGPGATLTARDDRRSLDDAALVRIAVGVAKLAPLVRHEPAAARSCEAAKAALDRGRRPPLVEAETVTELALRYVLDRDVIAIPRLHRRAHLIDVLAAAVAPPLAPDTHARIDTLLVDT
jgi:aryl-alcohol dehydrogenase-like predicted oxidoreductase